MKSVVVGIPTYSGLSHVTFICWQSLSSYSSQEGVELRLASPYRVIIDRARNAIADAALSSNADYVLFIDDDMTFEPQALMQLIEHDVDIVGGLFTQRVEPITQVVYTLVRSGGTDSFEKFESSKLIEAERSGALLEVDGIGMGFTLIKTDVLRKIKEKDRNRPLFMTCDNGDSGFLSEDLYFCLQAKKEGFKVFCDTKVNVGHLGEKVYSFNDFKKTVDMRPKPRTQ